MQVPVLKPENPHQSRLVWFVAIAILTIHAVLLAWSATVHSPNVNEPSHLAAGLSHWQLGRYELYRVNPPLVRMVAAIPVLVFGAKTDWSNFTDSPRERPEFTIGPDFIAANGERSLWLTSFARYACIPFSLLGGIICFLWARELYGVHSGLLGLTLWCFSPDILGHASCLTPDAHAAAVGLAANYFFWRWLKSRTWGSAITAAIVLGLALLAKTTWLVLLLLWPVIWTLWRIVNGRETQKTAIVSRWECLQFLVIPLLSLHVLNMGYQYDGTFRRLGEYRFVSRALSGTTDGSDGNRFRGTLLAGIPIPLPAQMVIGVDVQKYDFESHLPCYFRGKIYRHGFWYFYLYALAIKTPLGIWVLAVAATLFRLICHRRLSLSNDELVLLTPFFAILILASYETGYTAHLRYVLPILPYGFIWISRIGAAVPGRSIWALVVYFSLTWSVCSTLWFAPHWLAYFNETVGGPEHGHEHLANSNLDWGQDLIYLRTWLVKHPEIQPIGLAYYGMFHPKSIGIEFSDVPGWITERDELESPFVAEDPLNNGPKAGWYAVSVNFVVGHPFWNYRADGSRGAFNRAYFTWFKHLKPTRRFGYSIQLFHVTEADVKRLKESMLQPGGTAFPDELQDH